MAFAPCDGMSVLTWIFASRISNEGIGEIDSGVEVSTIDDRVDDRPTSTLHGKQHTAKHLLNENERHTHWHWQRCTSQFAITIRNSFAYWPKFANGLMCRIQKATNALCLLQEPTPVHGPRPSMRKTFIWLWYWLLGPIHVGSVRVQVEFYAISPSPRHCQWKTEMSVLWMCIRGGIEASVDTDMWWPRRLPRWMVLPGESWTENTFDISMVMIALLIFIRLVRLVRLVRLDRFVRQVQGTIWKIKFS